MSEHAKSAATASHSHSAGRIRRFIVRSYAFLILCIVLWTGYTAISYLARFVFRPGDVPAQFLDSLASGLPSTQPAAAGATPQSIAEPSIRHYHRDPQDFDFAGSTGCTTSGCHTLLPHTRRKEVRAFANFHSTFLDCSSCHDKSIQGPTPAAWLNNHTQRVQGAPAMLQIATLIDTRREDLDKNPAAISANIIALLRQAETDVRPDPVLHDLLIQMDTSEAGSPVWRQAALELQRTLPDRIRGEYGARITPSSVADAWSARQSRLADLTAEYQKADPANPNRKQTLDKIHEQVLAKPDACMTCHRDEPSRFDFEKLGYSPQRAAALRDVAMARMIEQIRQGQPFHMPELLNKP
jgi:hypothetical protein